MRSVGGGDSRAVLWAIPLLALMGSYVQGQECICSPIQGVECERSAGPEYYVGLFGGAGGSSTVNGTQTGTALYPTGGPPDGLGPLYVNARGTLHSSGSGLVGVQVGQEWSGWSMGSEGSGFGLSPALEFEGFYLGDTLKGDLINPTPRLPEHDFVATFPMDAGVFVLNGVVSLQTPGRRFTPYVGLGAGTAYESIHGADSVQIQFPEPGINHFDTAPNSSRFNFAWQAKVGVRFSLTERAYVFAEYRYLNLRYTDYTFGSTGVPGHIPTTPWDVHLGNVSEHLGVAGIGFKF